MNETPLEDQVHDALHRRADGVQRAPLGVTDVRTRARRIQRRRAAVAGVAVAAALAIAVPVGLTMVDQGQRSEIQPAVPPPAPTVTGTVRIDPRSAPVGDPTTVSMIDVNGPTLIDGDTEVDLPGQYAELVPYLDGWLGMLNNEGALTVQVLSADLAVLDSAPSDGVVVSPDGARLAWTEYDGTRWSVVDADATGAREERRTPLPPGPRDQPATPVGFASDTGVVVSQVVAVDGTRTSWIVDGTAPVEVPGMVVAKAATAAAGLVAGITDVADDLSSCSGVFDATARTGRPAWRTCDHTLVSFSPDGRYVVGFASYLDGNGSPTLAVLDAATGDPVVDFEMVGARRSISAINDVRWEDDDSLVAIGSSSDLQYVVRLGLDGSVERVGGPSADLDPNLIGLTFAQR